MKRTNDALSCVRVNMNYVSETVFKMIKKFFHLSFVRFDP